MIVSCAPESLRPLHCASSCSIGISAPRPSVFGCEMVLSLTLSKPKNHREVDLSLCQWLLFMDSSIITSSIAMAAHIHTTGILWLVWFRLFQFFFHKTLYHWHITENIGSRLFVGFFFCSLISHAFFQCVYVCEFGFPKSHCTSVWVLTTLLTPCDDWRAFCPIERARSTPCCSCSFVLPWGFLWKLKNCFSQDFFDVSSDAESTCMSLCARGRKKKIKTFDLCTRH